MSWFMSNLCGLCLCTVINGCMQYNTSHYLCSYDYLALLTEWYKHIFFNIWHFLRRWKISLALTTHIGWVSNELDDSSFDSDRYVLHTKNHYRTLARNGTFPCNCFRTFRANFEYIRAFHHFDIDKKRSVDFTDVQFDRHSIWETFNMIKRSIRKRSNWLTIQCENVHLIDISIKTFNLIEHSMKKLFRKFNKETFSFFEHSTRKRSICSNVQWKTFKI